MSDNKKTAEEFLKNLSEYDSVFDLTEFEYSESQLIDFAQRFSDTQNSELIKQLEDHKEMLRVCYTLLERGMGADLEKVRQKIYTFLTK
jgi:hypothetical protein